MRFRALPLLHPALPACHVGCFKTKSNIIQDGFITLPALETGPLPTYGLNLCSGSGGGGEGRGCRGDVRLRRQRQRLSYIAKGKVFFSFQSFDFQNSIPFTAHPIQFTLPLTVGSFRSNCCCSGEAGLVLQCGRAGAVASGCSSICCGYCEWRSHSCTVSGM